MTISPGEEFNIKATPSQELLRKLAYLAMQDNDSVLAGGLKSTKAGYRGAGGDKADKTADMMLFAARLADPAYQAVSDRINQNLDLMDEASVQALQEIEQELLELRRERERMLEQAYRDERGRRIFMTENEGAAFYEDGTKVADDEFARIKVRLHGKPTWEALQRQHQKEDELRAERDQIHKHEAERGALRDDLAGGKISKEEAERREQEIEGAMPERVRRSYKALDAKHTTNSPATKGDLNGDEAAVLNARAMPAQRSDPEDTQPATSPATPNASPFQPG